MTARRCLAAAFLGLAVVTGCSRPVHDAQGALDADAAGTIRFTTAGSILRVSASRFALSEQAATIAGDLRVPAGAGPFPLVVLLHGCGGLSNAEHGWVTPLGRAGYATFTVDSFRGRGLREVCTNSQPLLSVQRVPDAYGALRVLAGHPRIDTRRVALMGFSHGGGATLASATQWAKDTYPELRRVSAPLRIHVGEADDWTPASRCRERVEALRRAGFDADITVYPGAHH
ncbi:MAG TPA: dienelactone hydrolase family protein, partial [Methylomirabilota bacterium]|nr:dienelactone hydrolase family protein [Methylomirabilota bacterium]